MGNKQPTFSLFYRERVGVRLNRMIPPFTSSSGSINLKSQTRLKGNYLCEKEMGSRGERVTGE